MKEFLQYISNNWTDVFISVIGGILMYRFFYNLIIRNRNREMKACNRCEKEFNSSDQSNTICDDCMVELFSEKSSTKELLTQYRKDLNLKEST